MRVSANISKIATFRLSKNKHHALRSKAQNATYSLVDRGFYLINNILYMKSDINEEVGFNIRRIREERGLSQEELAALAGLHRAYVGQIERGEKNIGLKNLEKIAKALEVNISFLIDISDFPS